jgi:hypothetical protein
MFIIKVGDCSQCNIGYIVIQPCNMCYAHRERMQHLLAKRQSTDKAVCSIQILRFCGHFGQPSYTSEGVIAMNMSQCCIDGTSGLRIFSWNTTAAIFRSEFFSVPVGLLSDKTAAEISACHCSRQTVSGSGQRLLNQTPPAPYTLASQYPM